MFSSMGVLRSFIYAKKSPKEESQCRANGRTTTVNEHASTSGCQLDNSNGACYTRSSPPLSADRIRLVIFTENERHERKLLFDSESVRPHHPIVDAPSSTTPPAFCPLLPRHATTVLVQPSSPLLDQNRTGVKMPTLSPCGRFEFLKHKLDVKQLGEMLFGSMPISAKGESLKVHRLRNSKQMMISRVFLAESAPIRSSANIESATSSDSDSQYSTVRSLDALMPNSVDINHHHHRSIPMDVPDRLTKINTPIGSPCRTNSLRSCGMRKSSLQSPDIWSLDYSTNGCHDLLRSSSTGLFSSGGGSGNNSSNAVVCRHSPTTTSISQTQRIRLSQATTMSESDESSDQRIQSNKTKRRQLGFAILFNDDADTIDGTNQQNDDDELHPMDNWLLIHMHLIEQEMLKLQSKIQMACRSRAQVYMIIYKAWIEFRQSICILHDSPRLNIPVWLSLIAQNQSDDTIALRFCQVFAQLIGRCESKDANFFLSTLLSTVLTYNLTWVASVSPTNMPSSEHYSILPSHRAIIDRPRPYNPFWMQYLEICGSVGFPIRQTKTLLLGEDRHLLAELLFILSYFIRCSDVTERQMTSSSLLCQQSTNNTRYCKSTFHDGDNFHTTDKTIHRVQSHSMCCNNDENKLNHRKVSLPDDQQQKLTILPIITGGDECDSLTSSQSTLIGVSSSRKSSDIYAPNFVNSGAASLIINNNNTIVMKKQASIADSGYCGSAALPSSCSTTSQCPDDDMFTNPDCCQHQAIDELASSVHRLIFAESCQDDWIDDIEIATPSTTAPVADLGHSMLGGVCDVFCRQLALSALIKSSINMTQVLDAIYDDVRGMPADHESTTMCCSSSVSSGGSSDYGGVSAESVTIIADCTDWSIRIISSDGSTPKIGPVPTPCNAIATMVENFYKLEQCGAGPLFLLSYIEDSLSALLSRSQTLAELLSSESAESIDTKHVTTIVDCDWSDVRLLMNIAAVHSPEVLALFNNA